MATIIDIAKEAGVSTDTVSRTLNTGATPRRRDAVERAQRIRSIADRLGYRPNASARSMRSSRTRQIGVMLRNEGQQAMRFINPSSFETVLGITEGLRAADCALTLVHINDIETSLEKQSLVFREHLLDGMIVVGNTTPDAVVTVSALMRTVVWCDTDVWEDDACIRRDEVEAGRMVADWAIRQNVERVIWIGVDAGDMGHYSYAQRLGGLTDRLAQAGVPVSSPMTQLPWTQGSDSASIDSVLKQADSRTLVVAYDSMLTRWLLDRASQLGIRPGHDWLIASCDSTNESKLTSTWLPRAEFDRFSLGSQAAEMMLESLSSSDSLPSSLVIPPVWTDGQNLI